MIFDIFFKFKFQIVSKEIKNKFKIKFFDMLTNSIEFSIVWFRKIKLFLIITSFELT